MNRVRIVTVTPRICVRLSLAAKKKPTAARHSGATLEYIVCRVSTVRPKAFDLRRLVLLPLLVGRGRLDGVALLRDQIHVERSERPPFISSDTGTLELVDSARNAPS